MSLPVQFRLYLITDDETALAPARVAAALSAVPAGSTAVQLRARSLAGRVLLDAARALRALTSAAGAPLIVNDRVDIALAVGADGVHLPGAGIPVAVARQMAPSIAIGASTHSLAEARAAAEAGADFLAFGPVFSTPSKAGMGEPVGLGALAAAASSVALPLFALGGIDEETAPSCVATGARLACIRAVFAAVDPAAAAARLVQLTAIR